MSSKCIRNQIAVFGNFNFPVDSDTTVALLKAFGSDGFMPQTVQTLDPNSGLSIQRLTLVSNAPEVSSIVFAPDRIDVTFVMPAEADLGSYNELAVKYLSRVTDRAPAYSRIGLVRDYSIGKFGDAQDDALLKDLLPKAPKSSFEWLGRWIYNTETGAEKYNYLIEVMRQPGMGLVAGGRIETIDGIKVMHDVSTSPENSSKRFSAENLGEQLRKMAEMMGNDPVAFLKE